MKRLGLFFSVFPIICLAQLENDFERQNLTGWVQNRPNAWDTSSVEAIHGIRSLRHVYDNPSSGHDQISLCIDSLKPEKGTVTWRFLVRHAYNPSGANNWAVFLLSDRDANQMYPGGSASGLVLGVNFSGTDDLLKMWKQTEGNITVIYSSDLNWQERIGIYNTVGFEITRSTEGWWTIKTDTVTSDFSRLETIGKIKEDWIPEVNHFGIHYEYSSKQDTKFWFDDLYIHGVFIQDTIPPELAELRVTSANTLSLNFSEPLDTTGMTDKNRFLVVQESMFPDSVLVKDNRTIILFFFTGLPDGKECNLILYNMTDRSGNINVQITRSFIYHLPESYDVIVNEIMIDPEPVIELPEYEYIELFNRSEYDINLENWKICIGDAELKFPEVLLKSHEYLLLVYYKAVKYFEDYGQTLGLLSSKSSLSNNSLMIILRDGNSRLISFVEYKKDWHTDNYRIEGGWSLERIDTENHCGGSDNWTSSKSRTGGTPGTANSVYADNPDFDSPDLQKVVCFNSQTLRLDFDEPMDSLAVSDTENYYLDQGMNNPCLVSACSPSFSTIFLFFEKELQKKIIYHLEIKGKLSDCSGNLVDRGKITRVALPELPVKNDILFSEVLFNPNPGGVVFVELFNNSDKPVDMRDFRIATWNGKSGLMGKVYEIIDDNFLFFPREYLLLAPDVEKIQQYYGVGCSGSYIEMSAFPALDNKSGRIILLDKWLQVIDDFSFSEDMHFRLLNSVEGVSLERISFESSTNDPYNWHSAAEIYGFGTPGYKNSQALTVEHSNSPVSIEPPVFTPDNDGFHDYVNISCKFNQPGYVATIVIFDPRGRKIRTLVNNELLGTEGSFTWDGLDGSGRLARTGIYLIYIEVFDLTGKVRKFKKACVLSGRRVH